MFSTKCPDVYGSELWELRYENLTDLLWVEEERKARDLRNKDRTYSFLATEGALGTWMRTLVPTYVI